LSISLLRVVRVALVAVVEQEDFALVLGLQ
jgi:hypothetical protein